MCSGARAGQRLIAVDRRHELRRLAAHIPDVDGGPRAEQVLGEHVPLLRELRPQLRIPRAELARGAIERLQTLEAGRDRAGAARARRSRTCDSKKNGGLSGSRRLAPVPSMYCVMP